jgi:hypothetical protein
MQNGTFISFVTDYFVTEEEVHDDVKALNAKIDSLSEKIDELIRNHNLKDNQ